VVNIILLIAGNFMEPTGIILILAPILFPIATRLGIDPVHLGIIMVVNLEIGMVTPPVGLNLFVTSGITGNELTDRAIEASIELAQIGAAAGRRGWPSPAFVAEPAFVARAARAPPAGDVPGRSA
jgi:hypothetical protein